MRFSFDDLYLPRDYHSLILFAVLCVILVFPLFKRDVDLDRMG